MTTQLRSPLPWVGGKYYSAQRILAAFPPPESYDTYVDLFSGAAHVLLQKPPAGHVEVYNDIDQDLVNFWLHCRDHVEALKARCRVFPIAEHSITTTTEASSTVPGLTCWSGRYAGSTC